MFSYNSKFFQTVNQMIDCVFLSLLWIVFSLPVLTIGAATTALYHAVDKVIRREEGHLFKEFWRVFRRDFKRATILWIFMVLIFCILAANFYAAFIFTWTKVNLQVFMQIAAVFLIALCAIWLQYWFAYLARFDDPVKRILKNTLAMMITESGTDFRLLLLFFVFVATDVVISLYVPVLAIFMPVAYITSLNRITERLFARYIARQEAPAQTVTE